LTTWCQRTNSRQAVPISGSQPLSIARSPAHGARATGSTSKDLGPKAPPNQGYQLPFAPAGLYRAAIAGSNAYCRKTFGQTFERCTAEQKETFLKELSAGKITLSGGLPGRAFFELLYQNVMEGLFADPIYGGNKDKVGWKMLGFPGVFANNAENIKNSATVVASSPILSALRT